MTRTASDIDALLAAPKALAGTPVWLPDERGTVSKLAIPVLAPDLTPGLTLFAHATRFIDPQRGGCVLVLGGRPIQRLTIRPDHSHGNPLSGQTALRGRRFESGPSRLHAWTENRTWPRPERDNVDFAQLLDPEPASFSTALAFFLALCGIDGEIPAPPFEPRLL